ncbi:hypothetical protein [uncultured Phenylobacterium sp.]|uniref:hypothetical protein n=1 Tax=uncultured Phenylobacterium sp. TaxID=349273 RepID=UPI0025DFF41D|nr:hypothetical protein [uncultured Phenylobacterium sp.]
MKRLIVLAVAVASLLLPGSSALSQGDGEEVSTTAIIPRGMFVSSDNPSCGVRTDVAGMLASEKNAVAAGELWGPQAGAIVLLISQANRFVQECTGGELCRFARKHTEMKDHSSCATMCVATPPGATLIGARASDRDGQSSGMIEPDHMRLSGTGYSRNNQDYSAWANVHATRNENKQWLVCGTAKNWSDSQRATKILTAVYSE